MGLTVIDRIDFTVDKEALLAAGGDRPDPDLVERVIAEALRTASPKAMYRPAFVEERGPDLVRIEGVAFQSRVLAVNLESVERVFPFVVTCGAELEKWSDSIEDLEKRYLADRIKELSFLNALKVCFEHIDRDYSPGDCSVMNPGSLDDWPLSEQKPLFELLGDSGGSIGVRMLPSQMMYPSRTASGIRFPSEVRFESCMLCPRKDCPLRKAPHDPKLFQRKYKQR